MTTTATRILVVGSGGREHALAWRLQVGEGDTAKRDRTVFLAPGNAGAAHDVTCLALKDANPAAIVSLAQANAIDLVIIGPEVPLVDGAIDALDAASIPCVGPVAATAALEGSKAFMKDLCRDAKVDTAAYAVVETPEEVRAFIRQQRELGARRLVVKADGLCAGKGVTVCESLDDAQREALAFLGSDDDSAAAPKFGDASKRVILEEFLDGVELSVFALCDGERAHLFATARDHKRLQDGDVGPNTGGMGAVAPLDDSLGVTPAFLARVRSEIFDRTLRTLAARGTPYRGILYAGLMVDGDSMRLLEFNVRFGDPEAQALFFATSVDMLSKFLTVGRGQSLDDDDGSLAKCSPVACVVVASAGYPEKPRVGMKITLDPNAEKDAKIFFAGVKNDDDGSSLVTSGGRVLSACARAATHATAIEKAYALAATVHFEGQHARRDIGASVVTNNNADV